MFGFQLQQMRAVVFVVATLLVVWSVVAVDAKQDAKQGASNTENNFAFIEEGEDWNVLPRNKEVFSSHNAEEERSLKELNVQAKRLQRANEELEHLLIVAKEKQQAMEEIKKKTVELNLEEHKKEEELSKLRKESNELKQKSKKLVDVDHELLREKAKKRLSKRQVVLDGKDEKALADASYRKHFFNEYKSSLLPLDRKIPDTRVKECIPKQYDISAMPKTSVIICFVNEAWSALLRTVWSVLNRTPESLLEEIILLDDASDADWLGDNLIEYVKDNFPSSVRIVRSNSRLGLIRARLLGAKHAKGEVLTFLDSHCEANEKWLEPILDVIAKSRSTVVTPVIDSIDAHSMEYTSYISRIPGVGTFDWTLDFNWKTAVLEDGKTVTDPFVSPTMAGGLFSINKKYFYEIGSYDEGMDGWGGENIEMSFRIWQCGGRLVSAPCSHVGHIFRESHPYKIPHSNVMNTFLRNSKRLAEVWMDDYKKFFYDSHQKSLQKMEIGDISPRVNLRKKLKCKSFKWFLDNVMPDLFIPDKDHIIYGGSLQGANKQCVDGMGSKSGGKAGVFGCHGLGETQHWMFSKNGEIRNMKSLCLDVSSSDFPSEVNVFYCHGSKGNQLWSYKADTKEVKHEISNSCLCIVGKKLRVCNCDRSDETQQWTWEETL
eukprot:m.104556 g.104556  ORF g.104556 m.104556 type:complete len:659 (-) comp12640_c0_seq5:167-2143(-)